MLHTALGRLRLVAMTEGASFLLLLFVAMPLKYGFDLPVAVRVAGMVHGLLFVLLLFLLATIKLPVGLKATVFVASLLPFGPFVIDRRLRPADSAA